MEELLKIIKNVNDQVEADTENIMTDGILDSVELVELISLIEEHYKIEIDLDDIDSCKKIINYIMSKEN